MRRIFLAVFSCLLFLTPLACKPKGEGGTGGGGDTEGQEIVCGDDYVQGSEQCENVDGKIVFEAWSKETCYDFLPGSEGVVTCTAECTVDTSGCKKLPTCGNKKQEGQELCDDGNKSNTDSCTNFCGIGICGDGFVQESNTEICDNGPANSNYGAPGDDYDTPNCSETCVPHACGDGVVWVNVEACDNAWLNGPDGACSADCTVNEKKKLEEEVPTEPTGVMTMWPQPDYTSTTGTTVDSDATLGSSTGNNSTTGMSSNTESDTSSSQDAEEQINI